MAKLSEIIVQFINRKEEKERILGRYYASEIYSMIKGDLTPENFFQEKPVIDEFGAKCISSGISAEEYLNKVFGKMKVDCIYQPKKEIQIREDIILVVKPDFQFPDFLAEVKCPYKLHDDIPVKWQYQLECEYRGFYLPVYLWQVYHPFSIKQIAYTPSKFRWEKIVRTLISFHEALKKGR